MGHLHFTSREENRELRAREFTSEIFVHLTRSRRLRLQLPKLRHEAKQRLQQSSVGHCDYSLPWLLWRILGKRRKLHGARCWETRTAQLGDSVFGCGMQPAALRCLSSWVRRPSLILRLESFPRLPDATTVKAWVFISLKPSCQVWF